VAHHEPYPKLEEGGGKPKKELKAEEEKEKPNTKEQMRFSSCMSR
jgi:hypothetical protein